MIDGRIIDKKDDVYFFDDLLYTWYLAPVYYGSLRRRVARPEMLQSCSAKKENEPICETKTPNTRSTQLVLLLPLPSNIVSYMYTAPLGDAASSRYSCFLSMTTRFKDTPPMVQYYSWYQRRVLIWNIQMLYAYPELRYIPISNRKCTSKPPARQRYDSLYMMQSNVTVQGAAS